VSDLITKLRAEAGYDDEAVLGPRAIDVLIGYKDALEDLVGYVDHHLHELLRRAQQAMDDDGDYWTELATGQDSQEVEASGALAGQVAGLEAALAVLNGDADAAAANLDLHVEGR
jgi:hypothetical protein